MFSVVNSINMFIVLQYVNLSQPSYKKKVLFLNLIKTVKENLQLCYIEDLLL